MTRCFLILYLTDAGMSCKMLAIFPAGTVGGLLKTALAIVNQLDAFGMLLVCICTPVISISNSLVLVSKTVI